VAGGLYTVRGYEESIVAGDTVYIGSVEYRYHIPKGFRVQPDPRNKTRVQRLLTSPFGESFRYAPQQPYGRPDWDLIFRAFFDAGRTLNADRQSYETNDTLMGTGVGLELQLKRNLSIRCDWGFVLKDVPNEAESGDSRVHMVLTLMF
jgi:hemolysin activation/secretion protein